MDSSATSPFSARLAALAGAGHPQPAVAVTALVAALAVAAGRGPAGSAVLAAAVLTGQLSVGWSNDLVDLHRDRAAGRPDKPLATGRLAPGTVARAAGGALALCVPLSLAGGLAAGAVHLVGVVAAWAYNLGLKRTALSWLPYAVAFGLLPAFVTLGLPGRPWPAGWTLAAGALLGMGAHVANVLPDIEADLAAGVRGLPQRLGRGPCRVLAPVLLSAASVVLVLGPPGPVGRAGWATLAVSGGLAAVGALPGEAVRRGRLPFLATLGLALAAVALLVLSGTALT
ncbi:UbiA family prenyltransferase [Kitasatospora sp. NPDC052896]|uniref:UbiA family prenyltransferase n=1 Tax=Kitasatospora sp. NPDC052896 TaxID=3364061 RepID=UPI0037CC6A67